MKTLEVYLSPLAEQKLLALIDNLEAHWGINSKNKFLKKFKSSIEIINVVDNRQNPNVILKEIS